MKILLAAFGTRGDVQPMVALGTRLRADGHDVAIGASAAFAEWVRGHGLKFHAVGHDIEPWIRTHGDMLEPSLRSIRTTIEYLREDAELSFDQTYAASRGVDLIVSGAHAAAASVAEVLGVPHRTLLFCPQAVPSRFHPPPGVQRFSLPGWGNHLAWTLALGAFDFILKGTINRRRAAWRLPGIAGVSRYLIGGDSIVASDAVLGELPPDAPQGMVQTGALELSADGPLDPALERFLGAGEPPIYIGFGSMPDPQPRRTTALVLAALETCKRRAVIAAGWAGLGDGPLPADAIVVRSPAHALLLPRVALAVHHGGAGTTAAVARAGVPQIVVPHLADQFYWGHQMHRRGLGSRPIPRNALTASRLAWAIDQVLSRPAIAGRAREVATSLAGTDGVQALARHLDGVLSRARARRAA